MHREWFVLCYWCLFPRKWDVLEGQSLHFACLRQYFVPCFACPWGIIPGTLQKLILLKPISDTLILSNLMCTTSPTSKLYLPNPWNEKIAEEVNIVSSFYVTMVVLKFKQSAIYNENWCNITSSVVCKHLCNFAVLCMTVSRPVCYWQVQHMFIWSKLTFLSIHGISRRQVGQFCSQDLLVGSLEKKIIRFGLQIFYACASIFIIILTARFHIFQELYQQMLAKALAEYFEAKLLLFDVTDFSLKVRS